MTNSNTNINTSGTQLFNVPNTPRGREFCAQAQAYRNAGEIKQFKRVYRGPRQGRMAAYCLAEDAKWIALYANQGHAAYSRKKALFEHETKLTNEAFERHRSERDALQNQIINYDAELAVVREAFEDQYKEHGGQLEDLLFYKHSFWIMTAGFIGALGLLAVAIYNIERML